jgi:5-methylcytosine-specific restriction protein A
MPSMPPVHRASGWRPHPQAERERKALVDRHRPNAADRGYDGKWQKESKAFLALPGNELCACGCGRAADMVDHKVAHKGDKRLFWSRANWQPMHRGCNSRKAILQEGGFGKPMRRPVEGQKSE